MRYRGRVYSAATAAPQPRDGFITLKLQGDLGHADLRARMLDGNGTAVNEPTRRR